MIDKQFEKEFIKMGKLMKNHIHSALYAWQGNGQNVIKQGENLYTIPDDNEPFKLKVVARFDAKLK